METAETIDQQPEQQDPQPPKKYKVSEFASKIKKKYPDYQNVPDAELVQKIINKYPEYKEQVDFTPQPEKKKESGTLPSSNGQSQLPPTENIAPQSEPEPPSVQEDALTLARKADALEGKTIFSRTGGFGEGVGGSSVPDEAANAEGKKINDELRKQGFEPKKLIKDFEDIPDYVHKIPGYEVPQLLQLSKENPEKYERTIGAIKGQVFMGNELDKLPPQEGQAIKKDFNESIGLINSMESSEDKTRLIQRVMDMADKYGGDDKDKIKRNLGIDFGYVYGKLATESDMQLSTPTSQVNKEVALRYINDIHPEQLRKYSAAFLKDKDVEGNPEREIATELANKELEEIGINLRRNYLNEKLNPLKKEYDNLVNISNVRYLTDEEKQRAAELEKSGTPLFDAMAQLQEQEKGLITKYPKTSYLDAENFAQEFIGQKSTGLERFMNKTGEAVHDLGAGIYDMIGAPLSQDNLRQADIIGADKINETTSYLKQSNQINQTFKPQVSEALQSDIDAISNNKLMDYDQKSKALTKLLLSRTGEWQRTPMMRTNLGLKSLMYGISDMAASLVPFIGAEMVTGGGASAGFLRKFTSTFISAAATGFEESYKDGIKRGEANPYAYATRVTAINSAAIAGAQTPQAIRNMFKGQKTAVGELVAKMTDTEIESALKATPKAFKSFGEGLKILKDKSLQAGKNFGSAALSGTKDAAKINTFMTGGRVVNDAVSGELRTPEEYAKDFAIETLKFALPSAIIGGVSKTFRPTDMSKAALYEVATNKDGMLSALDQKLKDGTISQQEGLEVRRNIETASKIYEKNSPVFKTLDDKAKREYIYNAMIESRAKEAATGLPDKQAEKFEMQAEIAKHKNGLLVEPKTPEQLEKRKAQLEKSLIPEKDADGKNKEVPEKEVFAAKAEIAAIDEVLDEHSASVADSNEKRLLDKKEATVTLDEKGEEVKPTTKSYSEAAIETRRQGELYDHPKEKDKINAKYDAELAALKASEKNVVPLPKSEKGRAAIQEAMSRRKEVEDAGFVFEPDEDHPFPTPDTVSIGNVALDFEKHNKGLGTLGYILLGEEYLKQGKHLVSITPEYREGQATGVWKKLVKMGLAEQTSPGHYKYGGEREAVGNKSGTKLSIDKDAVQLLNEARDTGKLGVFKNMEDEAALKMISEQAQNIDATGGKGKPEDAERAMQSTVNQFGKELVDAAIEKYPAKEPVASEVTADGESKTTGIKNKKSNEVRVDFSLPKVDVPKLGTDNEVIQEGKRLVDEGEIVPREVVQRVLDTKGGMEPNEAKAMQYYMHQLIAQENVFREQMHEAETPEQKATISGKLQQLSDEVDHATAANIIAGKAWSDVGNIRQILIDEAFSPSRERAIIKDAYGGEIPKDVKERLDKLTKERDDAILEKEKVEKELRQKMTVRGFEKIKKDATKSAKTKETKDALKKEEEELIKNLKQAIKKDMNGLNSGVPIPKETIEALGKLAINYFKQGVVGLEVMVDKIYDAIKSDVNISRKEVKSIIANYQPLIEQQGIKRLNTKANSLEDKALPPTIKTKGSKFEPSEPTDYLKPQKEPIEFRNSTEWVKAQQRVANAEHKIKVEKRKAFESQKNMYQKGLAWAGRLVRLSVLSGYNVLGKLASAAVVGAAGKRPFEQIIGGVYSQAFKGIAKKAPIEGFFNARAEAKWYKEFFNPKKFLHNSWEILRTGSSDLGKKMGAAEYEHVPILYIPTDLHQIIKDPVKRGTFEASFLNGLVWAEKNGLDVTDPLVINSLENAAYKRAQYEIFQEQNWLSKKFSAWKSSMEKAGNPGATAKFLADFMIPVSTVPTNIVRRIITTSPLGLIRGGKEVVSAYRKGIESLTNEQAEHVMKQLKQGTLGTALWLIGWYGSSYFGGLYSKYNPDKQRKVGDLAHDEMSVGGKMVPKPVQHALPLEIIQFAATARHVFDNYVDNKKTTTAQALFSAGMGSIGALEEQIPVIETAAHVAGAFGNPYEAEKLKEDAMKRFQPQILKELGIIGKKEKDFYTEEDLNLPEVKLLKSKGIFMPDPGSIKQHKITVDKAHPDGLMTEKEYEAFKEKKKKYILEGLKDISNAEWLNTTTTPDGEIIEKEEKTKDLSKELLKKQVTKISTEATKRALEELGLSNKKTETEMIRTN